MSLFGIQSALAFDTYDPGCGTLIYTYHQHGDLDIYEYSVDFCNDPMRAYFYGASDKIKPHTKADLYIDGEKVPFVGAIHVDELPYVDSYEIVPIEPSAATTTYEFRNDHLTFHGPENVFISDSRKGHDLAYYEEMRLEDPGVYSLWVRVRERLADSEITDDMMPWDITIDTWDYVTIFEVIDTSDDDAPDTYFDEHVVEYRDDLDPSDFDEDDESSDDEEESEEEDDGSGDGAEDEDEHDEETGSEDEDEDAADDEDEEGAGEEDGAEEEDDEESTSDEESDEDAADDEETTTDGASNVLFLPGIQASRLHAAEDISTGIFSGYSAGDRVWEPGKNDDVRMLEMSESGQSVHRLYAGSIIDTITFDRIPGISLGISDVYAGISSYFDELVASGTIEDWQPYAYDWRHDVYDIVSDGTLVDTDRSVDKLPEIVANLADTSHSGQVSIIAHSNGGLLAKALLDELERTGNEDLVDSLVFIGVPQIGTPQSIATILHGYDQTQAYGIAVRGSVARETLQNFPAVYSLLPTERYMSETDTPIVSFDDSWQSERYRDAYGPEIDTVADFHAFLMGVESDADVRNSNSRLHIPATANTQLLTQASTNQQNKLSDWTAPSEVEVIEFVGVGLPTPQAVRYESILQESCEDTPTTVFCLNNDQPRPFLEFSLQGDETVMSDSAEAYQGDKETYYFDLNSISELSEVEFKHHNFTESDEVTEILDKILESDHEMTLPNHVTTELTSHDNQVSVERIASPVDILSEDQAGNKTGVVYEEGERVVYQDIPGSSYREVGDVKYLIAPAETDRTTTLSGTATGTYTYVSDVVTSTGSMRDDTLYQASTTPNMIATYSTVDGTRSPLEVDWNGDGNVQTVQSWDGGSVDTDESTATEDVSTEEDTAPRVQGNSQSRPSPEVAGAAVTEQDDVDWSELHDVLSDLKEVLDQLDKKYG